LLAVAVASPTVEVTASLVDVWEHDVLPTLVEYVAIPDVSPAFDADWANAGHIDAAVELLSGWAAGRGVAGANVEVQRLAGRTPLVVVDVPATPGCASDGTVLLYGHLDKQPAMEGWREGLGPWTPVVDGDRLYGRGGGDDGYSIFAAMTAIEAVEAGGGEHARCLVLIEASEESGSPDLAAHLDALGSRPGGGLGRPSLVICLDSSSPSYDRLWLTTSLRGLLEADLRVDVLRDGQHSGLAGGAVPSTFRIARQLLERVEDADTGRIRLPELWAEVPAERERQLADAAGELGIDAVGRFPYVDGARAVHDDVADQLRAVNWEPTLEVVAAGGLPALGEGGNVLRASTTLSLSVRLPPTVDAAVATAALEQALTRDPPHGASVTVRSYAMSGWDAPATAPWLHDALDAASRAAFGRTYGGIGLGGSIPFMAMLGEQFPDAQFVVTGVLGPDSNAHGPNEYLHLPTARRVTEVVARLLVAQATSEGTVSGPSQALG
jgi:acetylornithine deacetylase/succinyl-diaminopimelate desuccinylase-like protein